VSIRGAKASKIPTMRVTYILVTRATAGLMSVTPL